MLDYKTKPLNRQICKENLFLLKDLFDSNNVSFRLGYGTLLGAVRENNFIAWDNDVDLLFDKSEKFKLVLLLPKLFELGFVERGLRENFWGLNRKNNRVDFYFFSETNLLDKLRDLVVCKYGFFCVYVDKFYWSESTTISFLGKDFSVFKSYEHWLMDCYGADWQIPQVKKGKTKTFFSYHVMYFLKWGKSRVPYEFGEKVLKFYRGLVK